MAKLQLPEKTDATDATDYKLLEMKTNADYVGGRSLQCGCQKGTSRIASSDFKVIHRPSATETSFDTRVRAQELRYPAAIEVRRENYTFWHKFSTCGLA